MNLFLVIFTASIISLCLRLLPVLLLRNVNFNRFHLSEILDLASSCIIGQIIFCVAFNNRNIFMLINKSSIVDIIALACIILSFMICLYSKSIMKAVFCVLIVYSLTIILL